MKKILVVCLILFATLKVYGVEPPNKYMPQYIANWTYDETWQKTNVWANFKSTDTGAPAVPVMNPLGLLYVIPMAWVYGASQTSVSTISVNTSHELRVADESVRADTAIMAATLKQYGTSSIISSFSSVGHDPSDNIARVSIFGSSSPGATAGYYSNVNSDNELIVLPSTNTHISVSGSSVSCVQEGYWIVDSTSIVQEIKNSTHVVQSNVYLLNVDTLTSQSCIYQLKISTLTDSLVQYSLVASTILPSVNDYLLKISTLSDSMAMYQLKTSTLTDRMVAYMLDISTIIPVVNESLITASTLTASINAHITNIDTNTSETNSYAQTISTLSANTLANTRELIGETTNNFRQNQFANVSGSTVSVLFDGTSNYVKQDGVWYVTVASFPATYNGENTTVNIGTSNIVNQDKNWTVNLGTSNNVNLSNGSEVSVSSISGNTSIYVATSAPVKQYGDFTVNVGTANVIQDKRYSDFTGSSGVIATLTAPATTYFYGYGTSFSVSMTGSTATFNCSWLAGDMILDGTNSTISIGDNFAIPKSSPTYIYLDFPTGAGISANVYIDGGIK